jgi:hypothetical protein
MNLMRGRARAIWMAGLMLIASPVIARPQAAPTLDDGASQLPAQDQPAPSDVTRQDPEPVADPPKPLGTPSAEAWQVINWVLATRDNNEKPFMVIDKVAAEVFLFDAKGEAIGASPALVGMSVGDEATPGVADRELAHIPPKDRKTPAGRFIAKFGYAYGGRNVLWVDYPSATSLHAVMTIRNQHRAERLKSPTPGDNRITYGCINVPKDFYDHHVRPLFKGTSGVVYILPETKSLNEVFLAMPPAPQAAAAVQTSANRR